MESLGGLRILIELAGNAANPSMQSEAAASLCALHELALRAFVETKASAAGEEGNVHISGESVRALVSLAERYTVSARGHTALGIAIAALCENGRTMLVEVGGHLL